MVLVWATATVGLGAELPQINPPSPWAGFVETHFPFFSSVIDARDWGERLPPDNLTPRGVVLPLGHDLWAAFDLDLLRVAAIWSGTGVTPVSMAQGSYHVAGRKAPEGEKDLPRPVGTAWLANGLHPGWETHELPTFADPRDPGPDPAEIGRGPLPTGGDRFLALQMTGPGVRLEYRAGGALIHDCLTGEVRNGHPIVRRLLHLDHVPQPLWLILGQRNPHLPATWTCRLAPSDTTGPSPTLRELPEGRLAVRLPATPDAVTFEVVCGPLPPAPQVYRNPSTEPADDEAAAGLVPRRWLQEVVTRAVLGPATNAYAIDRIALPLDNPWRRNVRLADLAFFPDGEAAVVTFDGDVWRVTGLAGDLDAVHWRRFASGLHEPLGLAVRDREVFVHDRNGLWRLRDLDGNGEADRHELFANSFVGTAETREFASGLRVAPDGSFVLAKGGQRGSTLNPNSGVVLRVSPDGGRVEVLGHGFRQPFLGVHPGTGQVTVSDQQGHYIPTTPLHLLTGDAHHGFLPVYLRGARDPEPIAEPLTWIPHPINASGAGQVWWTDSRAGPLADALLHLGYYRPEVFLVRLNTRSARTQAAVISLTRDLSFAPLAGAVNPADGQLYLTGFQIWGTTAEDISGLARLRSTGLPFVLPREIAPMAEGILLRFDVPLDPVTAMDPANYSAECWNYRRTPEYGSPHYHPDGHKGQQPLVPSSAYLSRDGRAVFVGIPGMLPVMQMRLGWALATRAGFVVSQNAYFTPYEFPHFDPQAEGFDPVMVDLTPRAPGAEMVVPTTPEEGRRLSELMGCLACHSLDGSTLGRVGPTWKGLFGREREFTDGTRTTADEAYLRQSIQEPSARVVRGFEKTDTGMPSYQGVLTAPQIEALIAYLKTLAP